MRHTISSRLFAVLAALTLLSAPAFGQDATKRSDANSWKFGFEGGAMMIRTPTQDATVLPSLGAHFHIMANRTGLLFSLDEAFGKDEQSGLIVFNDVRRYQAVLTAHPFNGGLEPYFGLGGGINQVVRPRVSDVVVDPGLRGDLLDQAHDASTAAFATALFGLAGKWGRTAMFAQYQIGSAPSDSKLLRGVTHTVHIGVRINLGPTDMKEPVRR